MAAAGKDDASARISALGSMYQAERAESVTLLNVNIALLGAVLAYAAASVAFLDKIETLPRLAAALVPIPLWLGMLYSTLLVALSGKRGASALVIEDELFAYTGVRKNVRDRVGSRAGEYIVNPTMAPWPYRVLLGLVYVVPWGLVILYTVYMLVRYVKAGWMLYATTTMYVLLFVVVVAAYVRAFLDTPKVSPTGSSKPE
jgi:hypothetical protein